MYLQSNYYLQNNNYLLGLFTKELLFTITIDYWIAIYNYYYQSNYY